MVWGKLQRGGVYFIGIGGVSMSALAQLLQERSVPVRGCDAREGQFVRRLRAKGIPVCIGEEEIYEQTVVCTEAVDVHAALPERARRAGKTVLTRAQFLGEIAQTFPHVISVAGCHGKTSATCMLAHIFFHAKREATCHVGGEDLTFGNFHAEGEEYFLTEACEFRRSFLALRGDIAVVLSTDLDHTDCYADEEELLEAYKTYAAASAQAVVNADDKNAAHLPHALSFGLYAGDVRAVHLGSDGERYFFTVSERGVPAVRVALNVRGRVQIYNALAAYCAARLAGLSPREIKAGLEEFRGVRRRFEEAGRLGGAPVFLDYAHHPAEISAALDTAQGLCKGTVRVVFQPHTYTRTRDLMAEFVRVLRRAESPVIYRTYAAREQFFIEGSAAALAARLPEALYAQSPAGLKKLLLSQIQKDDLVLVLGAGDIDEIVRSILDE